MILRRLYLYLVSAVSIVVLAVGLSGLGMTILQLLLASPTFDTRTTMAQWTAVTLVAIPVWAIHQWFARRIARRNQAERASAIRHLYLYWACAVFAIAFTFNLYNSLTFELGPTRGDYQTLQGAQDAWVTIVTLVIWALHYRVAAKDRAVVGETGASATLRRWYMYSVLLVGLLVMLAGFTTSLQQTWLRSMQSHLYDNFQPSVAISQVIAGGLVWVFHARALAARHIEEDRKSTLRAVEGFIAVGVSIGIALVGGSQILYYSLARILLVSNPGGADNDLLGALAAPGSLLLVYGVAWFLMRRRLARDASAGEFARQAAIRRLYVNLASLVSLGALAIGAGGVLWTLAEQVEAPLIGVPPSGWRDPLSLWLTLMVVGGAVWTAHWRPAPPAAERQSLSRRLYTWAALLAGVLAVLGFAAALLYSVLQQAFQQHPRLDDVANLDFGHYLAAVVVAALVGLYHWRVLQADARARPAVAAPPAETAAPAPPATEPSVSKVVEPDLATGVQDLIDLVDWRRRVGDSFRSGRPDAITEFRNRRDQLFKTHSQSPIEPAERSRFQGLRYFAVDPACRVNARMENASGDELLIETGGADGAVRYRRAARLVFELNGEPCALTVLSLLQYGGGLFVPFKDATSGHETYGGGRYLFDTAKGTDGLVLEITAGSRDVVIDFNFAYNPSCVYSARWACPLAPPENVLKLPIRAGELTYHQPGTTSLGGPV